jgi:hypothetical protein
MVRFDADRTELALILSIVKRFERIASGVVNTNRMTLLMDMEACHCNGCPLDLEAMNAAERDMDLAHDVAGITRHLDRETGKLGGCFSPRFAARQAALA